MYLHLRGLKIDYLHISFQVVFYNLILNSRFFMSIFDKKHTKIKTKYMLNTPQPPYQGEQKRGY